MPKPTIKRRCVASHYEAANQCIAEFRAPDGKGGLLSLHDLPDGRLLVQVTRIDEGVDVLPAGQPRTIMEQMLAALKDVREWEARQGGYGAPVFADVRAAIAEAEKL